MTIQIGKKVKTPSPIPRPAIQKFLTKHDYPDRKGSQDAAAIT
jgi:hypothetical protein